MAYLLSRMTANKCTSAALPSKILSLAVPFWFLLKIKMQLPMSFFITAGKVEEKERTGEDAQAWFSVDMQKMLVDGSSVLKAFVSLSEQNSSMCYFYCSCFSLPRSISRNTAFIWKIFFVTEIVSLQSLKEGFHHPGLSKEGGVGALSFSAPIRAQ